MIFGRCEQIEPLRQCCPEYRQARIVIELIQPVKNESAAQPVLIAKVVIAARYPDILVCVKAARSRQNTNGNRNSANRRGVRCYRRRCSKLLEDAQIGLRYSCRSE